MAKDESDKRLASLAKLLPLAKDLHDKLGAVITECDGILGGKAAIGEQIKRVQTAFDAAWCARYAPGKTGAYIWRHTQDVPNIKRLLKTLAIEDIEARAVAYIRNTEPFFMRNRHTFGLFVSSINQHAAESETEFDLEPPVDGCSHQPPCRSDAEHTRRRREVVTA